MLYNTDKRIASWAAALSLKMKLITFKQIIIPLLVIVLTGLTSSCAFLAEPLDNRTGFTKNLSQLETSIRNENWPSAETHLKDSKEAWEIIKPLMQIDIDHDYIKYIEDSFDQLDAYLYTKNKSNALASILLIKSTWKNIGSL